MQNPIIATFAIFFVSILISVVTDRITYVIDKAILKRKENRRIEKQKKDWDNNQIIRRKFLSKYTLPESVLCLKNGEKDAIIAELPQIVSGIYMYRSPSPKYNANDWIPYPNPAIIFMDCFAICTHTFDHCLKIVENLKVHGVNVAADPFELEEKLKMGRNDK
mgnify:CR=1 FL=1